MGDVELEPVVEVIRARSFESEICELLGHRITEKKDQARAMSWAECVRCGEVLMTSDEVMARGFVANG